jgi:hypothetical protein
MDAGLCPSYVNITVETTAESEIENESGTMEDPTDGFSTGFSHRDGAGFSTVFTGAPGGGSSSNSGGADFMSGSSAAWNADGTFFNTSRNRYV